MAKSVLIADDHEAVRRELHRLFRAHRDFTICGEAADGADALSKAQLISPDLVILDLAMPEMSGLEVAAALQYILPEVPIFLLTVHYTRELELAALQSGVRAVFSKYADLETLVQRARAELDLKANVVIESEHRRQVAPQRRA